MNGQVKVAGAAITRGRIPALDFIELMKPELTGLSVLSALCGFYIGSSGSFSAWLFFHTALGTLLVGGGAGALNMFIERRYDAMMKRTERRPLPSGRLQPAEALIFGLGISFIGIAELTLLINVLTGFLGVLTWTTYLFLYTPLKRVSPISTIIGGIPGALPPVIGWAAARNDVTPEAWVLFAILFCWQMPHFFSLAWMYRQDYARAGFKILTVADPSGGRTGKLILAYLLALIPASLAPAWIGLTGSLSLVAAAVLGAAFLLPGLRLIRLAGNHQADALAHVNACARRLFLASLIYLPALMLVMTLDKV